MKETFTILRYISRYIRLPHIGKEITLKNVTFHYNNIVLFQKCINFFKENMTFTSKKTQ